MERDTLMAAPRFSGAWWEQFTHITGDFSQPAVLRGAFDSELLELYREGILDVLRELARLRTRLFGYRVYLDGEVLDGAEMDWIYDRPPEPGETLPSWAGRVFGERKFGIIINRGERFSAPLARQVALAFAPLFEHTGFPQEGVNFTIFIGNYDKTPLGIHQDKRGESVMHFHLGPGEKTMHLWNPQEFEAKLRSGQYRRADFDGLAPFSRAFRFGAGDVFFMPEGTYHIGRQDDFSVGLTVWRYNHSDSMLLYNLHQEVFQRLTSDVGQQRRGDTSVLGSTEALDPIIGRLDMTEDFRGLDYAGLLREAYRDRRYEIHSNGGYRAAAQADTARAALAEGDRVVLEQPFRMQLKLPDCGSKMYLYVRGHKIELNRFDCLIAIVEKLNEGDELAVAQLLDLLAPGWKREAGLRFLSEIMRHRGIRRLAPIDVAEPAVHSVAAVPA